MYDHAPEDLAKFGYRTDLKVEKFKNLLYILATCWNLLQNSDDFIKSLKSSEIRAIYLTKIFEYVLKSYFSG